MQANALYGDEPIGILKNQLRRGQLPGCERACGDVVLNDAEHLIIVERGCQEIGRYYRRRNLNTAMKIFDIGEINRRPRIDKIAQSPPGGETFRKIGAVYD